MSKLSVLFILAACSANAWSGVPPVPNSDSPDEKLHAVMDFDRDPSISPTWKEGGFPKIEIMEKATGKVVAAIEYFGDPDSDNRRLRDRVTIRWRADSKAFAIAINGRFYSNSRVLAANERGVYVEVPFPSYQQMTGFPSPESKDLRPRGRATVEGWDEEGHLIFDLFFVPLPTFKGRDPLVHRVWLKVEGSEMKTVKVAHETGEWQHGDWVSDRVK